MCKKRIDIVEKKNKDIVNVAKSSHYINLDQTMIGIKFDSFIRGIISIVFQ
jgi:hypothetical protein